MSSSMASTLGQLRPPLVASEFVRSSGTASISAGMKLARPRTRANQSSTLGRPFQNPLHPEHRQPVDIGRHPDIGERIGAAGEPRRLRKRLFHVGQRLFELDDGGPRARRFDAELDPLALALALHRVAGLLDDRLDLLRRVVVEDGMPVRGGIGQHAGHRVKPLVDPLGPDPHRRQVVSVGGSERRVGQDVVEIFADHRRFDDRPTVVDQGRHDRVGVELQVPVLELLASEHVHDLARPLGVLLVKHDPHLGRADRASLMI